MANFANLNPFSSMGGGRTTGGMGTIGPAYTRGEIEPPAGEKDMGGWTAAVYTAEQQRRLGVDESGKKRVSHPSPGRSTGGPRTLGPAWTRSNTEAPRGEKDMGGWTAAVYTAEQQRRLGVDESGSKTKVRALGPAWTRSNMEAPAGTRNAGGGSVEAFYTVEQQIRLKVDEAGQKLPEKPKGQRALGPRWTWDASVEKPQGMKDMGSWNKRVYTAEQQRRLSIDEEGNKVQTEARTEFGAFPTTPGGTVKQNNLSRQVSFGEFDPLSSPKAQKNELTRALSFKGMALFQQGVAAEDSGEDESEVSEVGEDYLQKMTSSETATATKQQMKFDRAWEAKEKVTVPVGWSRDSDGNLMGSILERVTSKRFTRKWAERQFIVKPESIVLIKTDAGKKGASRTVEMGEYTEIGEVQEKIDGKDRYLRIKVTSQNPWTNKETLLAQFGVPDVDVGKLGFLRKELIRLL